MSKTKSKTTVNWTAQKNWSVVCFVAFADSTWFPNCWDTYVRTGRKNTKLLTYVPLWGWQKVTDTRNFCMPGIIYRTCWSVLCLFAVSPFPLVFKEATYKFRYSAWSYGNFVQWFFSPSFPVALYVINLYLPREHTTVYGCWQQIRL